MTRSLGVGTQLVLFLVLSAMVVLVGQFVTAAPEFATRSILPIALTLDLLLWIPLFYWLLLVRNVGWPKLTVVPVILASVALAQWIIPPGQQGPLEKAHLLLVPLELGVLLYITSKAVHTIRRFRSHLNGDADIWMILRGAARSSILNHRLADAAAFEIAVFYYALFSWKVTRRGARAGFSMHRKSGYGLTVLVLLGAVAVEVTVLHLLLLDVAGAVVAWPVTLLSIYGAFWFIADYQAIRIRTTHLNEGRAYLRCGFRWDVEVAYDNIDAINTYRQSQPLKGRVDLVPFGTPAFLLTLRRPVEAIGIYGMRRWVRQIGLTLDDMPAFLERLDEHTKGTQHGRTEYPMDS